MDSSSDGEHEIGASLKTRGSLYSILFIVPSASSLGPSGPRHGRYGAVSAAHFSSSQALVTQMQDSGSLSCRLFVLSEVETHDPISDQVNA